MHLAVALFGATALFMSQPVLAQTKTQAKTSTKSSAKVSAAIPNDPNVKIGKLPNGLTYYIRKNAEPKNRAELYMAVKAGSLMENDAQQGLAHFTEHMAFNGTKDFPKNDLINYLQKAGVRFGADLNAYTIFNQTVYQLPIPTDSAALFKNGFKILANWAGGLTMDGKEIDQERGIIVEEDRQRGKNAQERMSKQLYPLFFANSRYAQRLPIGKVDILNTFKHETLRQFYTDWYRPNLQAVIAVGDFDVAQVEQLIKDNFSGLKNPAMPKPREYYTIPNNKLPLVKIVTDKEYPYSVAMVTSKHPGLTVKTEADKRKSLIIGMINSMISSRIQEIMQKGNAPFVFAQSGYGPYQGGSVWGVDAFTSLAVGKTGSDVKKALEAILSENQRIIKFGFTAPELDIVKKNLISGIEQQYKEKDKTKSAVFVQKYLDNFLTSTAIPSADYNYAFNKKAIDNITLAEVNKVAATLIAPENVVLTVQAPEKEKANLPTESELLTVLNTAGKNVTPYVSRAVNKPLLAQKPTAGKIVAEKKNDAIGVTELTLSNGIKVILKPTAFKNDQILFSSFGFGGISLASDAEVKNASFANVIEQSGIGEFDNTQLKQLLAGKNANAGAYIADIVQGFNGSAAPKDLETALQLVYAYATNPRKDADFFKKQLDDQKVILTNKNDDPMSVYNDTLSAVLSGYSKRSEPLTLEDLKTISLDKAFAFYKDRFADASNQTFVFVGNFDVNTIKPLLETYIASLPALNRNEQFVNHNENPLQGKVTKMVYKGLEDKATVKLFLHGDYDYNLENNIQLNALSEILEFKILERLREKESGVYSPNVGLSLDKLPSSHYMFTISFSCATANVDKLVNAVMEEVAKIKETGATADDITKFKEEGKRQMEVNLRENGYWLNYLKSKALNQEDQNSVLTYNDRLNTVTVQSTKDAAKKYLTAENYIKAVLLPKK